MLRQRPHDEAARDRHVEQRLKQGRRDERRVRGALDPTLREKESHDVAAAGGDEGVDARPRDVGAEDLAPADAAVRVRGLDDVAPRTGDRTELPELAKNA